MSTYELIYVRTTGRIAIVPAGDKGINHQARLTGYTNEFSRLETVTTIKDTETLEMIEQSKRRGGRRKKQEQPQ